MRINVKVQFALIRESTCTWKKVFGYSAAGSNALATKSTNYISILASSLNIIAIGRYFKNFKIHGSDSLKLVYTSFK